MNRALGAGAALAAAFLCGGFSAALAADEMSRSAPERVLTEEIETRAKVKDVDRENRTLTLELEDGETEEITVGPAVRRFDEIKKGDDVVVKYLESAALRLRKPGESAPVAGTSSKVQAHDSEHPSGTMTETEEMTATISNIDRAKRKVTLSGPSGKKHTVHVSPEMGDLNNVKEGDEVIVTLTRAMAVSIERPDKD